MEQSIPVKAGGGTKTFSPFVRDTSGAFLTYKQPLIDPQGENGEQKNKLT